MKSFISILFVLFSFSAHSGYLSSFENITVNPMNSYDYRVVISIHLLWDFDVVDREETIAAREALAIALKSLKLRDFTGEDSIKITKMKIQNYIHNNEIIAGNKIQDIYITDLLVEYTGSNKAYIYQRSKKSKT